MRESIERSRRAVGISVGVGVQSDFGGVRKSSSSARGLDNTNCDAPSRSFAHFSSKTKFSEFGGKLAAN
jgi:hypothetical protein